MKKGDKVIIIENLDDHVGYKGQVLTITEIDESCSALADFCRVRDDNGNEWYAGEEELQFAK